MVKGWREDFGFSCCWQMGFEGAIYDEFCHSKITTSLLSTRAKRALKIIGWLNIAAAFYARPASIA